MIRAHPHSAAHRDLVPKYLSPEVPPAMPSTDSSQPTLPAKSVGASPKWELPGARLHPSPLGVLLGWLVCWSWWSGNPRTPRTTRHDDTAEPIPGAWATPARHPCANTTSTGQACSAAPGATGPRHPAAIALSPRVAGQALQGRVSQMRLLSWDLELLRHGWDLVQTHQAEKTATPAF